MASWLDNPTPQRAGQLLTSNHAVGSAALALFLAWIAYTLIYNLVVSPLSKFPGPKLWAISRIPSQLSVIRGRTHLDILELHNRYGPVVRIGPNELAFSTPGAFRDIYASKQGSSFKKDRSHYVLPLNGVDNLVTAVDEAVHARHRRLLAHAFSERALRDQEGLVRGYVDMLVKRLREQQTSSLDGKEEQRATAKVDIKSWLNFTTFDILGDLMFGESFGCLQGSTLNPWIGFIFNSIKSISLVGALGQFPWLNALLMGFLPKKVMQQAVDHFELGAQKVDRRLALGATDRPDFMSYVLRNGMAEGKAEVSDDEKMLSRAELHSNAFIIIIAGSETSATLLSGAVYYLTRYPETLKKLVNEIRSNFSSDDEITFAKAAKLSYLSAVIEEALRVYPPFVTSLARVVPKGGATVDGSWVPEDTIVACHHYATYHYAANFSLPDEFIPERWLDDERFSNDKKDVLNPFSLGPARCLGINLAYAEIRLILCKLLFNFDVKLCSESERWTDQEVYFLWDKPELMVELRDRFV